MFYNLNYQGADKETSCGYLTATTSTVSLGEACCDGGLVRLTRGLFDV